MSAIYEQLIYSRLLIEQGQLWRLISGHFVHLGAYHALLNMSGLIILLFINRTFLLSSRGVLITLFLCLWVSSGLWFFSPDVYRYAGFSGVLHGLFVYAILSHPLGSWPWKTLMLFVITGKVAAEQTGLYDTSSLAIDIGGNVLIDAHLYGLTGGLFVFVLVAAVSGYGVFKGRRESNDAPELNP